MAANARVHRAEPADRLHAHPRPARLRASAAALRDGPRLVLARRPRRSRHSVLRTVSRRARLLAWHCPHAMVRRRTHEHRPQLSRQVDGHARPASSGTALGRRRRHHADDDLRGAAARGQSLRQRVAPDGHRPRRSCRAVHADVPRAGRSVLCRHQRRRHRAAVVLRVWC